MNSKIKIGFLIVLILIIVVVINVVDSKDTEEQYCEKNKEKCVCEEEKILYDNNHYNINVVNSMDFIKIYADDFMEVSCETNSMYPFIVCNNVILLKRFNIDSDKLKVNDIVVFEENNPNYSFKNILHRIIEINEEGKQVLTKGDNNSKEDNRWIDFEDIKYIVVGVIYT